MGRLLISQLLRGDSWIKYVCSRYIYSFVHLNSYIQLRCKTVRLSADKIRLVAYRQVFPFVYVSYPISQIATVGGMAIAAIISTRKQITYLLKYSNRFREELKVRMHEQCCCSISQHSTYAIRVYFYRFNAFITYFIKINT